MIAPAKRTMETVDLDLPGARALRLSLYRDAAGEPESLTIAAGWSGPFRADDRGRVEIPAHLIPELKAALNALEDQC